MTFYSLSPFAFKVPMPSHDPFGFEVLMANYSPPFEINGKWN